MRRSELIPRDVLAAWLILGLAAVSAADSPPNPVPVNPISVWVPIPSAEFQTGKVFDAFNALPSVDRISRSQARLPDAESAQAEAPDWRRAIFAGPAHFPLPAFDQYAARTLGEAAVIHEGMALTVLDPHGNYELRLVVEAPRTRVTLRLQLHVDCVEPAPGAVQRAQVGTITLPPMTLDPDDRETAEDPAAVWLIQHRGNSPVLRQVYGDPGSHEVRRTGTARFGTVPRPTRD